MSIYSLYTDRLTLKVLDETHVDLVLEYLSRNREFHRAFVPLRSELFYTKLYQRDHLKQNRRAFNLNRAVRFHILKKHQPKMIIGDFGFDNIIMGSFLSCFLGYQMDEKEINNGYMTEAIQCGIDYMFNTVGLHRIEANVMPANLRSIRVVEKLAFEKEGLSKDYLKINGKWEDHEHWVKLNPKV